MINYFDEGQAMDHDTALRSQVTERYILGELTPPERDEFEEHMADCSRCMDDVSALDAFAANAHAAFDKPSAGRAAAKPNRWLELLGWRPFPTQVSVALNLALLLVAGYERGHVVPGLEADVYNLGSPGAAESPVPTHVKRGSLVPVETSSPFIIFKFDIPHPYPSYTYSIEASGGNYRRTGALDVPADAHEFNLTVPTGGLKPGDYVVRVNGLRGSQAEEIGSSVTLRVKPRKR